MNIKTNHTLTELVKRYDELQLELQIVCYEASNKLDQPNVFFLVKEAEEKGLEKALDVLKGHILVENKTLGNPDITDFPAFIQDFRKTYLQIKGINSHE